jgi:hypothetical protein
MGWDQQESSKPQCSQGVGFSSLNYQKPVHSGHLWLIPVICYLGSWDWENQGSRPAWASSLQVPISKITREEWTGDMAQAIECLLASVKPCVQNPIPPPFPPHTKHVHPNLFPWDKKEREQCCGCQALWVTWKLDSSFPTLARKRPGRAALLSTERARARLIRKQGMCVVWATGRVKNKNLQKVLALVWFLRLRQNTPR